MQPYEPQEDTYILLKHIKKYAKNKKDVLEIGTGIGILAIEASRYAKKVTATDINPRAIDAAKKNANGIPNITFNVSDLFSAFKKTKKKQIKKSQKFNLIIFNPPYLPEPYLPEELMAKDIALDGGKHGYEVLERFLTEANDFLKKDGKIMVVFSKITKPEKIKEIISANCLTSKEIDSQKIPFEELYVWLIEKSRLLKQLEKLSIINIKFFAKGKRGFLYQGKLNNKRVIIKTKNPRSEAKGRIDNEIKFLKILEKYKIAPKILLAKRDFFVYEYISGVFIKEFIEKSNKNNIIAVLKRIFDMMFLLDKLKINKGEMHHPLKHIILDDKKGKIKISLVDFERANCTKKPKNVTQFCQFLIIMQNTLKKKKIIINQQKIIYLAKIYKNKINKQNVENIKGLLK